MINNPIIPEPLRTRDQWICWEEIPQNGKKTKIPLDPNKEAYASVKSDQTWSDLTTALEHHYSHQETSDGIGFVFTSTDPLVGICLPHSRNPETGRPTEQAKTIIDQLHSYTEVSPSGTGYHILVRGELPAGQNKGEGVELVDRERFFAVTGDHVSGTPSTIEYRTQELEKIYHAYIRDVTDEIHEMPPNVPTPEPIPAPALSDDALLEKARNASNGEKFKRLWAGSTSEYDSYPEAEMELCCLLAYWSGGHPVQMNRLFKQSKLCRPGWNSIRYTDGSTHGEKVIARAIEHTTEFFESPTIGDGDEQTEQERSPKYREYLYLNEQCSLLERNLLSLETQLEEKAERVTQLERRLASYEG
ncbi:hypothetical protein ACLI4R_18575 [Natrialbaceae archaeon A-chndr2]